MASSYASPSFEIVGGGSGQKGLGSYINNENVSTVYIEQTVWYRLAVYIFQTFYGALYLKTHSKAISENAEVNPVWVLYGP